MPPVGLRVHCCLLTWCARYSATGLLVSVWFDLFVQDVLISVPVVVWIESMRYLLASRTVCVNCMDVSTAFVLGALSIATVKLPPRLLLNV